MQVTIEVGEKYFDFFSVIFERVVGHKPSLDDFEAFLSEDVALVYETHYFDKSSIEDAIHSMFTA